MIGTPSEGAFGPGPSSEAPTSRGKSKARIAAERVVYEALTGRYPCFDPDDEDEERIAREDAEAAVSVLAALGVDLRMEAMGMTQADDVWLHAPGPGCPRRPCLGRDDRCPNGRWVEAYVERT